MHGAVGLAFQHLAIAFQHDVERRLAVAGIQQHAAGGHGDRLAIRRHLRNLGGRQHRKRLGMQGCQAGGRVGGRRAGKGTGHGLAHGSSARGAYCTQHSVAGPPSLVHLTPVLYKRAMIALLKAHESARHDIALLSKSGHLRPIIYACAGLT
ncbi:hypothetical protein G6F57_017690 [Rhizopus arrhizus]|nr:hypothetical protein G6F57_017690 [Rhizopus arrhizus]